MTRFSPSALQVPLYRSLDQGPPRQFQDPHPTLLHSSSSAHLQAIQRLFIKNHISQINPTATMVAQTAAFKKAVEESRKLKAKPNNDELLEVPSSSPLSCPRGVEGKHADRSLTFSSTQTTSKEPEKTSQRPRSPALSLSRSVDYTLSSPFPQHTLLP